MPLPLDSTTLRRLLRNSHGSHFLGVFPIDRLPVLPSLNCLNGAGGFCMIVNTDPSSLPGTHWLAVYINGDRRKPGEVFDSYGRVPPLTLQRWLTKYCTTWTHTKRFLQGPLSSLCGVYCIFVLDLKCTTGRSFKEIVDSEFCELAVKNDSKMRTYLEKL